MSGQIVNLIEWERREPCSRPLAGAVLPSNSTAKRLAEALTKDGRIEILELARGLELRATSYVGRFALGELIITISPKIRGVSLMNLLRYAYKLRHLELFEEVDYATSEGSFHDLLIHQLVAESSELLSRGLHRDYCRTESVLASPRGRINFRSYMQLAGNAAAALQCIHYVRSEDTCLNQVLHGGLELAAQITNDLDLRSRIRRISKSFAEQITSKHLDVSSLAKAWLLLDRRTSVYRSALTLVQMLLNSQGVALAETNSLIPAAGFLFDMNRFFQVLLSRFLRENLVGYAIQDEKVIREVFSYDPANNPHNHPSPTLRPDFVVMRNNKIEVVLDAKYRDLWEKKLPREMLYQLALYAVGLETPKRRAVILYPTLEAAACQQIIFVKDPLRGMAKAEIVLRPVNLLHLELLLSDQGINANRKRMAFAKYLTFGE